MVTEATITCDMWCTLSQNKMLKISCPADVSMVEKEEEKVWKYISSSRSCWQIGILL